MSASPARPGCSTSTPSQCPNPTRVSAAPIWSREILAQKAAGRRPRAFYLVPDHSNPSGNTVPLETRRELLDLAARHDLLLLEDSPYRLVSAGERVPTLKSMDRDRRVVHIGSFAKSAFPGARVGFVVADQEIIDPAAADAGTDPAANRLLADELSKIKSMITVNTSPLSQASVAGMLLAANGRLSELNERPAAYYRDNLNVLLGELDANFPAATRETLGVRWNEPSGGFFLKVDVPFRADNEALFRSAREFGVLWTPMMYFYPNANGGQHTLRLSFSALTPDSIREGVAAPRPIRRGRDTTPPLARVLGQRPIGVHVHGFTRSVRGLRNNSPQHKSVHC